MGVPIQKILDALTSTYDNIDVDIVDLCQSQRDYIVMPYLMTKQGGMREMDGGIGLGQILMVNAGGKSRFVGEYDEDVVLTFDHLEKARLDFCLLTDGASYSLGVLRANSGKSRIVNCIEPVKRALYVRVLETMEDAFFQEPDADDDKTPFGLKYWIVKNATTGFNGGYPTGFTTIANLSLTKVPQFKNYTIQYADATKTDLIRKLRKCYRQTKWKSPKPQAGFKGDTSDRRILLCNEDTIEAMEEIGEAQNENLGRDIAPMTASSKGASGIAKTPDGDILFKRLPIVWAEQLDSDTSDPVYGLDLATIYPVVRKGDNMAESAFEKAPKQHRILANTLDHAYQFFCVNRRCNFVASK